MALLPLLKNLRSNIVWRAAQRRPSNGLHVPTSHHQRSKAEVANLGIHLVIQKDVAHFQISVNNTLAVHVFDGAGDLDGVESDFGFGEALSTLYHVHKRPVGT